MIREFMLSKTKKSLVIISTTDNEFYSKLENNLHFKNDERIKFVGTVYDQELLKKIRENAYGYLHGHEVGGTNPSLLEALSSTKLNLLLNIGFNKEVAQDSALYWNKDKGNLSALIDKSDLLDAEEIIEYGLKSKKRISDAYTWDYIADEYRKLFLCKK
jgi:rhamnosyltransferase